MSPMDQVADQETRTAPHARSSAPAEVIGAQGLGRQFGSVEALADVTFTVRQGDFLAIMGPSGSGKTTLLNILSLLDAPTSGSYRLDGIETATLSEADRMVIRREKVGLVFQTFHLIPYLSAVENVMLAQHYHSVADREEALAALERVGLGHRADHRPSQLSGGEQQRVCIARALINAPALILADEPTGNLDADNEARVLDLLESLRQEGRTIVLVTHNPDLGARADSILRLQHGRQA